VIFEYVSELARMTCRATACSRCTFAAADSGKTIMSRKAAQGVTHQLQVIPAVLCRFAEGHCFTVAGPAHHVAARPDEWHRELAVTLVRFAVEQPQHVCHDHWACIRQAGNQPRVDVFRTSRMQLLFVQFRPLSASARPADSDLGESQGRERIRYPSE